MKITKAKYMGFCQGVKRAVNLATESGAGSYTLGPLIHNPQMINRLKKQGITPVDSLYGLKAGSKVIFRSHGEGPSSYNIAQARELTVIDATCPHVKKAQEAAEKFCQDGYRVVIIGEAKHPEVISIKAWGGANTIVIGSSDEVDNLPAGGRYGIVVQTTCTEDAFQKLSSLITDKASESKVARTICKATSERQQAAVELAKNVDTMIVVGGKNSANTNHLRDIVAEHCSNTIFIETADELLSEMLENSKHIGVTAGASTPDWLIEEVINKMEEMQTIGEGAIANIKAGEIITGVVSSIAKDEVYLDIQHKSDGIILRSEMSLLPPDDLNSLVKVGDSISAMIINPDKDGCVILSKVRADSVLAWERLAAAQENGETLETLVTAVVKGGITVDVLGVRGFIPASHVDVHRIEDFSPMVGQKISAKVIELENEGTRKRVVLSRREVLKEEKAVKEKEFYNKIKSGEKYEGTVSRLANFGAFIDIGGVDGLVHISDMAWHRVKHPSDILNVGDKVQVLVQKVDVENKKISLSLRDLQPDPWFSVIAGIKEGQILEGKVSKFLPFGVFVLLENNAEGLVHISEIAEERIDKPESVLKEGQPVKVKVLGVDKKSKKISLSIAQAKHDAEKNEFKEYLAENNEFTTSIGSKFDLSKLLDK